MYLCFDCLSMCRELTTVGAQHVDHSSRCANDDLSSSLQLSNLEENNNNKSFIMLFHIITFTEQIFIGIDYSFFKDVGVYCLSWLCYVTQSVAKSDSNKHLASQLTDEELDNHKVVAIEHFSLKVLY